MALHIALSPWRVPYGARVQSAQSYFLLHRPDSRRLFAFFARFKSCEASKAAGTFRFAKFQGSASLLQYFQLPSLILLPDLHILIHRLPWLLLSSNVELSVFSLRDILTVGISLAQMRLCDWMIQGSIWTPSPLFALSISGVHGRWSC